MLGNERASAGNDGIGGGCTILEGCLTPIECDATGRKLPQQDRSHKRWREANGGAQCGKDVDARSMVARRSASMSAPGGGCVKTPMFKVRQRDQVPREAGLMFGSLPNAPISVETPELPTLAMIAKRCRRAHAGASHCAKAKKFFRSIVSRCLPSPRVSV
jgi:hypothetical protein